MTMTLEASRTTGIARHPQFGKFVKFNATCLRRKRSHVQGFANKCVLPPTKPGYLILQYPKEYVEVIITQPGNTYLNQNPKIYVEERFFVGHCIDRRNVGEFSTWDEMKTFVAAHYGITSGITPRKERKERMW